MRNLFPKTLFLRWGQTPLSANVLLAANSAEEHAILGETTMVAEYQFVVTHKVTTNVRTTERSPKSMSLKLLIED